MQIRNTLLTPGSVVLSHETDRRPVERGDDKVAVSLEVQRDSRACDCIETVAVDAGLDDHFGD